MVIDLKQDLHNVLFVFAASISINICLMSSDPVVRRIISPKVYIIIPGTWISPYKKKNLKYPYIKERRKALIVIIGV